MGSSYSSFREALRKGNAREASDLYYTKKSLRDSVLPNHPLGYGREDNTALHFTAKLGLRDLYVDLVNRGGKPDQKNKRGQNCLHLICGEPGTQRTEMLRFTLEAGLYGMDLAHVLEEKDEDGNTVLHLAAGCGLQECVELLVNSGADVFLTNKAEETAADCATKHHHTEIATELETKMVFRADDQDSSLDPDPELLQEIADAPTGMRDKDLRTMKDTLLIETVQLLGVSLFTAEALLRHNGWSKERLLECWMANPAEACEAAGVQLPTELGVDNLDQPLMAATEEGGGGGGGEGEECGVCMLPSPREIRVPCEHHFCRECWQQYLHSKIESGDAHSISCPEYGCYKLVPVEVIESVVSREMAQKYLHFDIKDFVDSNPNIRWCPHPGCGQAVRIAPPTSEDMASPAPSTDQAFTVDCGHNHFFCWRCSAEPHEPCTCEQWGTWLNHVEEMKPKIGDTTVAEVDEAASSKWLANRSKPCPKCKVPIERTEGCNHMCCRKCKHDFCWVCLDEWRHHNSSTGGYFECNRYNARKKAEEMLHKRRDEVMSGFDEVEKLRRFLHYYERYKTHQESLTFEEPYLHKARDKMEVLARSVQTMDHIPRGSISAGSLDMSFIEEAVRELLHSRRTLKASYGFGYYIKGNTARRMFENMQGALEEVTEMLAEVVARPHLRKPRSEIIRLTREAREKRLRLVRDIKAGLPSPTPPRLRRYPFLVHDEDRDSLSSLDSEDGHFHAAPSFMRLLEDLSRRSPTGRRSPIRQRSHRSHFWDRQRPHRYDVDEDLQQVLELSRQEYEAQTRLNADIELAKALSELENPRTKCLSPLVPLPSLSPPSPPENTSNAGLTWLHHPLEGATPHSPDNDLSWLPERDNERTEKLNWLHCPPERSPNNDISWLPENQPAWPILTLPMETENKHYPSSPPNHVAEQGDGGEEEEEEEEEEGWGPLYGEEEDLRRAIEMSLAEHQERTGVVQTVEESPVTDNSSPQFLDSNYLAVTPPPPIPPLSGLPPELRHLLQSDDRPGEQV